MTLVCTCLWNPQAKSNSTGEVRSYGRLRIFSKLPSPHVYVASTRRMFTDRKTSFCSLFLTNWLVLVSVLLPNGSRRQSTIKVDKIFRWRWNIKILFYPLSDPRAFGRLPIPFIRLPETAVELCLEGGKEKLSNDNNRMKDKCCCIYLA